MAREAIVKISVGDVVTVNFDCAQGTESLPAWAAKNRHEVTNFELIEDGAWTISIKKGD